MKRTAKAALIVLSLFLMLPLPTICRAGDGDNMKWYGIGGELNEPKRWFGRIGINEYLGTEVIFALEHVSPDCKNNDCDYTRVDIGAGVIYDLLPGERLSPYLASRFILVMTDNGDSETSATVEAAGGVEYLIMEHLGVSVELNARFHTDPTEVGTTTRGRFYVYF